MSTGEPLIMVVEDEARIASILGDYLRASGFRAELFHRGDEALAAAGGLKPDLVLLDLMLPGLDGLSVCRELRRTSDVPIVMVTARVEEIDRLLGLELGADDYICKPFSPREVVARVKAVLRRLRRSPAPAAAQALALDEERQCALAEGRRLDLTTTEYRLLRRLMSRPGRVYSRAELLDSLYDPDQDVSDRAVDSHVKNLRRKIEAALPGREVIHSVYGVGYRYEE